MPPDPLARTHDVAFLAPGLVHQFGNLLLTIHGNALVLDGEHRERAKAAIHGACDRGGGSLRLLRALLGEGCERDDAATVLRQLGELLRVPLREAGHGFETRGDGAAAAAVELGAFVPLVVRAVRTLVELVPEGIRGVVLARIEQGAAGSRVVVRFRPPAGTLPFPVPLEPARAQLAADAARLRWHGAIGARSDGFDFQLDQASAPREAQA